MVETVGWPTINLKSPTESVVLWVIGAWVALIVVLPLMAVLWHLELANLRVLSTTRVWVLLGRSTLLALSVTVGALAIGVPAGALFAKARIPLVKVLFGAHVAPVFLPPFFAVLGWSHVISGELGRGLFFGPVGVWAVLTTTFAPIITTLTALGIQSVDPSREEAARLVASPRRVLTHVLVPAAGAQIGLGALIVFAMTFSELGVPMFLRVDVFTSAVFSRLGGIDVAVGEAAALCLPVVILGVMLSALERRWSVRAAAPMIRSSAVTRYELGLAPIGLFLLTALSVAPLASLAWVAWAKSNHAVDWIGASVANGLFVSCISAATAALVGIPLGLSLARGGRFAQVVDACLSLGFILPSAVLGVGVVTAWNHPETNLVYSSAAILVLGLLARYTVLSVRILAAAFAQTSPSYEDSAAIAGAGYAKRLLSIVVPMHWRAVVVAFGMVLVFCLRDLETVVLYYPAGDEPLTVRIFTLEANGPPGVVETLALIHTAVTGVVLTGVYSLVARRRS